ncbi:CAP domain-containing protein [Coprinopsis sp. MPI-PUGE-AT-0042]|nr:CAP domain-containing protein [Coprinopsis sp. MPI-PUGE-AT-0042]
MQVHSRHSICRTHLPTRPLPKDRGWLASLCSSPSSLLWLLLSLLASLPTRTVPLERRTSQEWLDAHNTARERHNATALTWGDDLEAAARKWAEGCVFEHSRDPTGEESYGENIAAGAGRFTISGVVAGWLDECTYYDEGTTHFTQVVWKNTTRLGCFTATCNPLVNFDSPIQPSTFHVCQYDPAGNWIDRYE